MRQVGEDGCWRHGFHPTQMSPAETTKSVVFPANIHAYDSLWTIFWDRKIPLKAICSRA